MSESPRTPDYSAERLREAFAQAGGAAIDEAQAERIWRAVTGELSPEETRNVVDETARDPEKAMAWRVATGLVDEARADGVDLDGRERKSATFTRATWALAASLLVLAGLIFTILQRPDVESVVRGTEAEVENLTTGPCSPGDCSFAWSAVEGASEYRFSLLDEELLLLSEAGGLTETSFTLPPETLEPLDPGSTLLWSVEARASDGSVLSSSTFRRSLMP